MLGLTSLVDVVFILLFFFMLAARESAPQALSLTVSDATETSAAASTSQGLLRVLGSGRIELDGRVLELSALMPVLRAGARDQVKVAVAPAAQLQDLIDVLEPLRAAGIGVHLLAPAA
ncbi:ExbD/TolR family protein [Sinimarinibacterium sp. CAU 1509]|uniref:ExbD/TolR family protein n=1 Tax=Sinimarinibacterium sp. CAU 1509 TaxID=2562283 RepID=UPI00146D3698|nr:biopolymer transporter ExbD [Sinimarinibacterium sp. CAU 1509]